MSDTIYVSGKSSAALPIAIKIKQAAPGRKVIFRTKEMSLQAHPDVCTAAYELGIEIDTSYYMRFDRAGYVADISDDVDVGYPLQGKSINHLIIVSRKPSDFNDAFIQDIVNGINIIVVNAPITPAAAAAASTSAPAEPYETQRKKPRIG